MKGKKFTTFGEIMLRLSVPNNLRIDQANSFDLSFAGSEANVAFSLARFGLNAEYITGLPSNDLGRRIKDELRKSNISSSHSIDKEGRIGTLYLERGAAQRSSKVIYDRTHSVFASLQPGDINWEAVFAHSKWFHWSGITPSLSQNSYDLIQEALKVSQKFDVTVSVDLNYRTNLWNYGKKASEIMPDLVSNCDIILGNEEDIQKCLGFSFKENDHTESTIDYGSFPKMLEKVFDSHPRCKIISLSLRHSISADINGWSGLCYDRKNFIKGKEFQISNIVDRVGAGDAFSAGFIFGLNRYANESDALNFAICSSCLKHSIQGDFNFVTIQEVESLMAGNSKGRIQR